ncbi:hypothetical protein [Natrinema sp. CGMCC1.2065]|uniref:hypothetical protein n=1 Tax=Natrinema sp. CGMCC1.2065 TaxID=3445767 RepID=UPI003F4A8065
MRLTPSWLRSSSADSAEERSEESDPDAGSTAVYAPGCDFLAGDDTDTRVGEFLPESNAALVTVLDEMAMPATVDEITDALVEPADPPIETWAAVHERLHEERLPALDASGAIEFDETQGLVERSATPVDGTRSVSPAVLVAISIGVLLVVLAFGVVVTSAQIEPQTLRRLFSLGSVTAAAVS